MIWYGLGACLVLGNHRVHARDSFDLGQLFAGRSDDSNESAAEAKNADEPEENSRVDGTYGGERMSEKDVKDNETEALNNAAAEKRGHRGGETDMATSIERRFRVVYDDGGDLYRNRIGRKRGKYGRHRHGRQR